MRFGQGHLLPFAAHKALRFPSAKDPADGIECRSRHPGNVPARDRKIDGYAILGLAARLVGELQQCAHNTLLDLFSRHFDNACLGFLQPAANSLISICRKGWDARHERLPLAVGPSEIHAINSSHRSRRIGCAAQGCCNPENLARPDVAGNNLLPEPVCDNDPDMAIEQQIKGMRCCVLFKDRRILRGA